VTGRALLISQTPWLISGSNSPSSSRKERRYRENLETDILNNSAAIIRWQRIESEVSSGHHGHPYSTQRQASTTPSKELQWLSNLVPYKPPQPQIAASNFSALPPIPETPDSLNEEAQMQIIKTVDVLLAKWTTLYAFERPRRPKDDGHASPKSDSRPKSTPAPQVVGQSVDRVHAGSNEAPSDVPQQYSADLAADIPEDSVYPADSGNINCQSVSSY
jgi:hypothetical protein